MDMLPVRNAYKAMLKTAIHYTDNRIKYKRV